MSYRRSIPLALAIVAIAASCGRPAREVVAYTSVDQPFAEPIFRAFEEKTGVLVRAVYDTEETKSTGVVNRLIAESSNPRADIFWSGDPVRPFLLIKRGLVEPYASREAAGIPQQFRATDGTWTGNAARARILLVNRTRVSADAMPSSIRDLAKPAWKGQTAIANPVFGTTTMHVAALFAAWGDERARAFLEDLHRNDVRVASSNGEVKRLVAAGEVAFGVTDTDDASEAMKDSDDLQVMYPDQDGDGTLVMPTTIVLLKGPNRDNGRRLVDYLVSADVERRMTEHGHVPLRPGASPPPGMPSLDRVRAMPVDYAHLGEVIERIQPMLRRWSGM